MLTCTETLTIFVSNAEKTHYLPEFEVAAQYETIFWTLHTCKTLT